MYDLRLKNIPAEVWMGILVLACTILLFTSGVKNVLPASGSVEKKVILIDAGHGGDDPGKIGINQAKEKDINLAIAKKLKVCLEKAGFEVVMTREADESVKGPEQGNKKPVCKDQGDKTGDGGQYSSEQLHGGVCIGTSGFLLYDFGRGQGDRRMYSECYE